MNKSHNNFTLEHRHYHTNYFNNINEEYLKEDLLVENFSIEMYVR